MDKNSFINDCRAIRRQSPLVHNITNYVAMPLAANALLAIGASPLMSFCPEEMEEIVAISSAVAVNIGCIDNQQIKAMHIAAAAAKSLGKPWILDPVGAGASTLRTKTCLDLIEKYRPTIIRGNASEIKCLAGGSVKPKGVDSSVDVSEVLSFAKSLAKVSGAVVSVSGSTDFITDGERVETVGNGDAAMTRITAMGCAATSITAAFAAVQDFPFAAAAEAMALMGVAGERAARKSRGTGSMAVAFLDELSTFEPEDYANSIIQTHLDILL